MNIGEYIKKCIKENGRTTLWVSEKLGINYKTFVGKLNRNTLSADELFKVSILVDIDLEEMKSNLEYNNILNDTRKFIYVAIERDEQILDREKVPVIKMEICEGKKRDNEDEDMIYGFIEVFDENGSKEYIIEEISSENLKNVAEATPAFMLKKKETGSSYLLRKMIGGSMLDDIPRKKSAPSLIDNCMPSKRIK